MADIMDYIRNEDAESLGHLIDLEPWSEDRARALAAEEGLELSAEHLQLLQVLRDHYRETGKLEARTALALMEAQVADKGGKRYLYTLFPGGPVRQATRLAGLPVPAGSTDRSFGSVM